MGKLQTLLESADGLREEGNFSEALSELSKAKEIAPRDPEVYLYYALTFDSMGDIQSSIYNYKHAIELDPADAYLWTQMGITLGRTSKLEQALASFEKALDVDHEYTFARWNIALIHRSMGCYEYALDEFNACAQIEPDSEYVKSEIHYQMGLCYFDMGWTLEALKEFTMHLSLYPQDPWANLSLGNCYSDCGWVDEAIRKYRDLIDDHPEFIPVYNALALSLAEKGWYDEALEILRKALEISPNDKTTIENMDYIQSLSDDEYGYQGSILFVLLHIIKSRYGYMNNV